MLPFSDFEPLPPYNHVHVPAVAFSRKEAWGSSPVPSIPDRVLALAGSCVVVPCFYTLPAPGRSGGGSVAVRLRFRRGGRFSLRSTAFNSENPSHVTREFFSRTSLSGQISEGDCSLRLDPVRLEDSRSFEITLKGPEDWGTPSIFTLEVSEHPESPVISSPGSFTEGQLVSLNCTVDSFCPSRPPVLRWHWERGSQPNSSDGGNQLLLHPETHRPLLLSSLSFTASHLVKPRLSLRQGRVRVEVQSLAVHEGGSVLLGCVCKADPPVTAYRWSYILHGRTVHLDMHTHTARLRNATRGMLVRCSAHNLIGRGHFPSHAIGHSM
ncbi:Sialoadhesin [Merluccius polli]|uniref:Sialoadhesin n=1 Tax=Merluccius polli TaxID=89951 RepID=A0AA47P5M2_MERPO|nr:Sialoadhesin [Merluccius polli]